MVYGVLDICIALVLLPPLPRRVWMLQEMKELQRDPSSDYLAAAIEVSANLICCSGLCEAQCNNLTMP